MPDDDTAALEPVSWVMVWVCGVGALVRSGVRCRQAARVCLRDITLWVAHVGQVQGLGGVPGLWVMDPAGGRTETGWTPGWELKPSGERRDIRGSGWGGARIGGWC